MNWLILHEFFVFEHISYFCFQSKALLYVSLKGHCRLCIKEQGLLAMCMFAYKGRDKDSLAVGVTHTKRMITYIKFCSWVKEFC